MKCALRAPIAARYAPYRQFTLQNGKHLTKGKWRSWEQGVESKIEGLIEVLREDEGRILEICRSGKMTMRRGHHISSVLKAMDAGPSESPEPAEPYSEPVEVSEDTVAGEPE